MTTSVGLAEAGCIVYIQICRLNASCIDACKLSFLLPACLLVACMGPLPSLGCLFSSVSVTLDSRWFLETLLFSMLSQKKKKKASYKLEIGAFTCGMTYNTLKDRSIDCGRPFR